MNRDYKNLLPKVLVALYPDKSDCEAASKILSSYGKESYQPEQDRVQLGILKLASTELEKLESFTKLACEDYRDLLCAAEYPLSSQHFVLREKDPGEYKKLQEKEATEYDNWLAELLSA